MAERSVFRSNDQTLGTLKRLAFVVGVAVSLPGVNAFGRWVITDLPGGGRPSHGRGKVDHVASRAVQDVLAFGNVL